MIKAKDIDQDFRALNVGDTFTCTTKRGVREYVVCGIKYDLDIRIPQVVRTFPNGKFLKVQEVHNC